MNIKKLLIFSFFGLFTAVPLVSSAQPELESVRKSIEIVLGSDRELTREEHSEFWRNLSHLSPSDKKVFIQQVKKSQLSLFSFTKHMWECADRSWTTQKVSQCPEAERSWTELSSYMIRELSVDKARLQPQYQNYQNLLNAASKRAAYVATTGERYDLSDRRVIQETFRSFSAREKRFTKALNERFDE